jgi:hypothetical protein
VRRLHRQACARAVQSSHPVISTDWLKPNRRKLIY